MTSNFYDGAVSPGRCGTKAFQCESTEAGGRENSRKLSQWGNGGFNKSEIPLLGGGNSNIFGIFIPKIGEDEPILKSIFFRWVGSREFMRHGVKARPPSARKGKKVGSSTNQIAMLVYWNLFLKIFFNG